ncbi:hypothetical protein BvCmsNSNP012_04066 [Escherichia coli]|nr:hypothetical protein BvCmsNSNP012_04066 [Escherichia coli]
MAIATLARKTFKIAFYIAISWIVGRSLGSPETWINPEFANQLGHMIYGPGDIGADNFYDLYFYISVITIFSITSIIYILIMTLLRKKRNK